VPVQWTPTYFALTHQKTLVVDGKTALVMTFNFTPQYYATSRDFGIVDTDAKDVSAIEGVFSDDWQNKKDTADSGDDLIWSPGASTQTLAFIAGAQRSLDIYNEEMNDQQITDALAAAAKRGVAVRVVMTFDSGWRSAFKELSAAGVAVHIFAQGAPVSIHAKMILADGSEAFVGSQNFSPTSLNDNRELGLFLSDPNVLTSLESTFNTDFSNATAFTN
jgi:cardiolipin synthase